MIPDWRQALAAAGEALRETGTVHVVDFGDLTGLGGFGATCLRTWLALFHVEPRVEILHGIERLSAGNPAGKDELWIAAGRYAFLWTCPEVCIRALATMDVAAR
jgi:S-adenosylmethionine-diacylgycerolhomoserine-N-methlytransferase